MCIIKNNIPPAQHTKKKKKLNKILGNQEEIL